MERHTELLHAVTPRPHTRPGVTSMPEREPNVLIGPHTDTTISASTSAAVDLGLAANESTF